MFLIPWGNQIVDKKKFLYYRSISANKWMKSGEGNGTPFQYSCLENPMDGGAW